MPCALQATSSDLTVLLPHSPASQSVPMFSNQRRHWHTNYPDQSAVFHPPKPKRHQSLHWSRKVFVRNNWELPPTSGYRTRLGQAATARHSHFREAVRTMPYKPRQHYVPVQSSGQLRPKHFSMYSAIQDLCLPCRELHIHLQILLVLSDHMNHSVKHFSGTNPDCGNNVRPPSELSIRAFVPRDNQNLFHPEKDQILPHRLFQDVFHAKL